MKIETPLQKLITEYKRLQNDAKTFQEKIFFDGVIAVAQTNLPYEREVIEKSVGIHIGRNNNGILKELSPKQYFEQTFKSE